ncbi:MAG: hypothetical protein CL675_12965 [Bdellovibrionaceae bacterium]|nr:hypothetical protein [Pseudobdellovibrionaceae bacterium]
MVFTKGKKGVSGLASPRVYIVPTGFGFAFVGLLTAIVLTGATYGNNLVFSLSFLLMALFVVSMIKTNNNLKKLHVRFLSVNESEVGGLTDFHFEVINEGRFIAQALQFRLRDPSTTEHLVVELKPQTTMTFRLSASPEKRGLFKVPRVHLRSVYPLGLFRSWRYFQSDADYYVYPKPSGHRPIPYLSLSSEKKSPLSSLTVGGYEDFREHRRYVPGDPVSRIDWNQLAKRDQLLLKQFEGGNQPIINVGWEHASDLDVELCLSQMSQWVMDSEKSGLQYQLKLPEVTVAAARGREHYKRCQRLLADFKN